MNDNEIARIAAATNALRPDWPAASIETLIRVKLTNRSRRDTAVALAWVACDSRSRLPGRVLEAGPWWKAAAVEGDDGSGMRRPPTRDEECRRHPGEWQGACRICSAPKPTDADEPAPDPAANARDLARAQLASARSHLCPHGVQRIHCTACEQPDPDRFEITSSDTTTTEEHA